MSASAAIKVVSEIGHVRSRQSARRLRSAALVLILLVVTGLWYWQSKRLRPLPTDSPVAVLLPIPPEKVKMPAAEIDAYLTGLSSEQSIAAGAVVANAKRLWEGFSDAFEKAQIHDRHHDYFAYPFQADTAEGIINKLNKWYKDDGVRTFVVTMSGAVVPLKKLFTAWADKLPANDRPVLLATVASAPDIPDRAKGIFRHFIRSAEESSVFATYIRSLGATEVGIFYVGDPYGDNANKILRALLYDKGPRIISYQIDLQNENASVRAKVPMFVEQLTSGENAVAVIIGYGSMMKAMIDTLEAPMPRGPFRGKILVASTFTEESWRPDVTGISSRIKTVGPGWPDDNTRARGVVYQFSYLTLMRALRCKTERGVEAIWSCLSDRSDSSGKDWANVEFTNDGDSIVTSLRLLDVVDR